MFISQYNGHIIQHTQYYELPTTITFSSTFIHQIALADWGARTANIKTHSASPTSKLMSQNQRCRFGYKIQIIQIKCRNKAGNIAKTTLRLKCWLGRQTDSHYAIV